VHRTLKQYFSDRRTGEFHFHMGTIEPAPKAGPDKPVIHGEQVEDKK
jgi:hypothetical protein